MADNKKAAETAKTEENKATDTASKATEAPKTTNMSSDNKKAAETAQIFFVKGYGNVVGVKSQAEAEKKAAKILADRRK